MNYPVVKTFRDRTSLKRYVEGGTYETNDQNRAEHLQKEGFIGSEIKETKPKKSTKGKEKFSSDLEKVGEATSESGKKISEAMKKLSDTGGDANESSKTESKDTPAKEE
ncbi:hypothetical protein [Paenibacillus taichungensis]|uniref:hypothetical protein n=1 Tax=Paenibacillus taichungensis TaxID=484184 RepID=UPI0039A50276